MISACFNPSCGRELKYLRDGRVIRVIRSEPGGVRVEHFWLCGSCHEQYDFCFANDKSLTFARRLSVTSPKRFPELRRIVERIAS
jgi:hypothetical protein